MRKFYVTRLSLLVFTVIAVTANSLALASTDEARAFIEKVSKDALGVITSDASAAEKEAKLTNLFITSVDTKWMARFALGKFWRDATEEQHNQYIEAHKKFLLKSYIPKFREFNNQQIKIIKAQSDGDGEYMVETKIISTDGTAVNVAYKVRKNDGGNYMIFDVVAEGVSLITTQRSDFASVLSREGVDTLITKLGAKG